MAVVQGIREKVHLPLYDSLSVESEKQLRDAESSSTMKFFVNVQGKTKLETNLQSASLLPHYNTFEARAMRVVISDLPPEFPEDTKAKGEELPVTDPDGKQIDSAGNVEGAPGGTAFDAAKALTVTFEPSLSRLMDMIKEARDSGEDQDVEINDDDVTEVFEGTSSAPLSGTALTNAQNAVAGKNGAVTLSLADLEGIAQDLEKKSPPLEQLRLNDGAGTIIGKLVYNTVTTFFVGEKTMISMPTWFFPAGAGPYSETGKFTTHGEPSPTATFRFAEPIYIDKQQNFRVEIEIPDSDTLKEIQKIYGPLKIWVVLDGYMTRDVQ
jgi:hypothetical protein